MLPVIAACSGPQSALDPAGSQAAILATLWWWLAGGALLVWAGVMAVAWWVSRRRQPAGQPDDPPDAPAIMDPPPRAAHRLILVGGVLVPVVVLTALLGYGLWLMPQLRPALPGSALTVQVSGEQWWWRVRYPLPSGGTVELANEIRLPLGEPVAFELSSPDVIHSFWVPALGGKMDMIPGRSNRLVLQPTRAGRFRGACAEYCGTAHALMALDVVVLPPAKFQQWLQDQARPALPPQGALAERGARAFLAQGCGACHAVRGTPADGRMGPDLTHVGSRLSLAAGTLPADAEAFARFVGHAGTVKPGVRMPSFAMLQEDELAAIAAWLEQLQ